MRTVVTRKGTTTIPRSIRERLGIQGGSELDWSVDESGIHARICPESLTEAQRHILRRAGSWDGRISGKELLKRTRP